MKPFLPAVAIAISLAPAASAQERLGDAALGGLSGALVLGPVGAVAGVIVGYTAGPSISRSWGAAPDAHYAHYAARPAPRRTAARTTAVAATQVQNTPMPPVRPAAQAKPAWNAPPVVGFE